MEIIFCLDDMNEESRNKNEIKIDEINLSDFKKHLIRSVFDAHRVTFRVGNVVKILKDRE